MLTNLLVVFEDNPAALSPYALSLAKALNARVTAAWPRRDGAGLSDGSMEARYDLAIGDAGARKAHARDGLAAFAAAAADAGVEVEALTPDAGADPRRDQVSAFARAFDLTVIGQLEPGRPPPPDDLAGLLLEESGRPVIVVPAIQRAQATFKRVVVAWDGSAASARAVGDVMPLISRAEHVEIVTVTTASTAPAVFQGGGRLAARLSRDGVAAEYRRLPSEEDAANAILSYVADVGADLLVAGGYGHSRRREALFGGVTRTLLGSQTLPLFLSR